MKKIFKEWIIPIVVAIVLATCINRFLFFIISVPTESMYPTIKPGDKIGVTKVYNTSKLKRGDCVVFYSNELGEMLIKRLIGLPGDKMEITDDGDLVINGNKIEENYIKYPGGKKGIVFNVPKDKFVFLGDNRANSLDARYWENPYIDKKDIKGKAQFIIFPFNRIGNLK